MEITLIPDANVGDLMGFDANLAEALDDNELQGLAEDLIEQIDADTDSRKDWADTFVKGLDVLGFKYEERTDPWEGACGVYSTVCRSSHTVPSGNHERNIPVLAQYV